MDRRSVFVFGIIGVLIAMAIVLFIPKNCTVMATEGFQSQAHCKFNARAYADLYPDLKTAFGYDESKLRNHYLQNGIKEGRTPCGHQNIFCKWSEQQYLAQNKDVKNTGIDALDHYKRYGIFEGRSPCPPPPPKENYTIGKCPVGTRSFTDKSGNINCCKGQVNGNVCEGTTVCTFSETSQYKLCSTLYN